MARVNIIIATHFNNLLLHITIVAVSRIDYLYR